MDTRGNPKSSQSTTETRKHGEENEKTYSQSNEDFLIKEIDLDDPRLFGKTSTTRRPYRFRPATTRERIREKINSAVSIEVIKEVPLHQMKQKPIQRKNILGVQIGRTVENNALKDDAHFKTRRRKIGVKQRANVEESYGTKNKEFKTNEETESETQNYKNDKKNGQNTNNQSYDLTESKSYSTVAQERDKEENTAKTHPVFNSFPIVKDVKYTHDAKQRKYSDLLEELENNVEQTEAAGLSQSHEDYMEMLSKIQEKQNFDLAAVKSEMTARKLNQEFFKSQTETAPQKIEEPNNPFDGEEPEGVEESKNIQSEGQGTQNRKYDPQRLIVLSPPTVTKPRRKPSLRTTPRLEPGTTFHILPRVPSKPTANTEATISLISWEQLSY